ncbi:class F sortase [Jatrophihabitans sp.]|uniref:class F sortase n=1 Tax=Jatrophihabitans sp. TaxID=1932789 RepID=UPI002CADA175|nr:class F sortase [Jatrophihabitans sp.]
MTRTAALALWSTVVAVGCAGAAVVLVGSSGSAPTLRAIDPGAPTRLASSSTPPGPSNPAAPPPAAAVASPSHRDTAARTGPPVGVRIGSIDIAAPIQPVGVDNRGDVAIPERVDTVGWYRFSAPPGSVAGSTVLVGHVDSARQGKGAFYRLRDAGRDDRVVLDLADGRRLSYRVVSRVQFPKDSVPLAELFALDGRPRLTLITCGGSFDATVRSYRDNVVITAVPL